MQTRAFAFALAACFALPAAAAPRAFDLARVQRDARAILDELLVVDTSHGHESDALKPIAARFRAAGVPVELLESAPGRGNLVARLKGSGAKQPLLLLAHVDVVPVEGQPWTSPPFKPTEKDGYLIARGVGDDKSMAAAIVAEALELARTRAPLSRDLIVALTAGEETGGLHGVRWLVEKHPELVRAEIALNEGGALILAPGEKQLRFVGIGSAEKSFQSYELISRGKGGHSSAPSKETDTVTPLARALVKLGDYKFPARVLPAVKESLALRATWEKPPLADALRHAVASAPKIAPADDAVLSSEPTTNNMIRTTCVATMLEASPQDNVLPTTAKATINCRILPDETRDSVRDALVRVISDPKLELRPLEDVGVSPPSPIDGELPSAIRAVAARLWPGVPVAHSMGSGATDSRHLRTLGVLAYGISVAPMTLEEALKGHAAHGPDERRPLAWLPTGIEYLDALVHELEK